MTIADRQDDDRGLRLLRAASAANQGAARVEAARGLASLVLVVVAVIFAILGKPQPVLAAVGFAWTLMSTLLLVPVSKRLSVEAATVQEHFDTYVFTLPWNKLRATKLDPERLHELATRYRSGDDRIRRWYPDTDQVSWPFNVLICQRANLMYDVGLRERWARIVEALLACWVGTGVLIGCLAGMTVWNLLLAWFIPSSAAILLGFEIIRAQRQTVSERKIALATVTAELDHLHDDHDADDRDAVAMKCREIQDAIFETRKQPNRVPGWLYRLLRTKNEAKMKVAAEELGSAPDA
ncbi:S-4TM family putative pore-forming effector [Saccharothrix deserti]|uniref:S-4TM family putative pore-forming effector n=1 Tax=Saccharothrix deserti TaxID=2593674 RepID=UPI00131B99D2|nr:S-4TM family putative pore-forming effector [Saccharothrix deserti]